MNIEPGKEYVRGDGQRATIQGLARRNNIDGLAIYWSLQGDHYARDGRIVSVRRVYTSPGEPYQWETYLCDGIRSIKGDA